MAVYERTWRRYLGELTPLRWRWLVVTRSTPSPTPSPRGSSPPFTPSVSCRRWSGLLFIYFSHNVSPAPAARDAPRFDECPDRQVLHAPLLLAGAAGLSGSGHRVAEPHRRRSVEQRPPALSQPSHRPARVRAWQDGGAGDPAVTDDLGHGSPPSSFSRPTSRAAVGLENYRIGMAYLGRARRLDRRDLDADPGDLGLGPIQTSRPGRPLRHHSSSWPALARRSTR